MLLLVTVHLKGGSGGTGGPHRRASASGTGGNAEELALRLGQSRVQLGLNLPARSLPDARKVRSIEVHHDSCVGLPCTSFKHDPS